jgi:hypothetical protein
MRQGFNEVGYWPSADVPQNKRPNALATSATMEYLNVMEIPLRRGRFVTDQDRLAASQLSRLMRFWRNRLDGQDPVGKRLWMPDMDYGPSWWWALSACATGDLLERSGAGARAVLLSVRSTARQIQALVGTYVHRRADGSRAIERSRIAAA